MSLLGFITVSFVAYQLLKKVSRSDSCDSNRACIHRFLFHDSTISCWPSLPMTEIVGYPTFVGYLNERHRGNSAQAPWTIFRDSCAEVDERT
jgi:hypothetical protein